MTDIVKADELNELDIDTLLDLDIDSVEQVKEFKLLPKGAYNFEVAGSDLEEVNGKPTIIVRLKVLEVLELVDELGEGETEEDFVGQTMVNRYILGEKKFMFQLFVTTFQHCKEVIGAQNPRELIEGLAGMQVTGIVKHRRSKNDAGEEFVNAQLDPHALYPTT